VPHLKVAGKGEKTRYLPLHGGDQRTRLSLGHANIATTHIYDHRKTRAWKSVRLKEQY
jgi:site-specific recombinase XerD